MMFLCLFKNNKLFIGVSSNLRNFVSTWVLFFLHLLFIATDFSELQIYQSGFPSNMCESITKKDTLSGFSLKAMIWTLIGVLCLVSPMA